MAFLLVKMDDMDDIVMGGLSACNLIFLYLRAGWCWVSYRLCCAVCTVLNVGCTRIGEIDMSCQRASERTAHQSIDRVPCLALLVAVYSTVRIPRIQICTYFTEPSATFISFHFLLTRDLPVRSILLSHPIPFRYFVSSSIPFPNNYPVPRSPSYYYSIPNSTSFLPFSKSKCYRTHINVTSTISINYLFHQPETPQTPLIRLNHHLPGNIQNSQIPKRRSDVM